jgi:hypothetical protein
VFAGFYQARFETSDGRNCGVITLTEDNKLCGGNNELMYVGTYTRQGTNFFADVEVKTLFGIRTSGGVFREAAASKTSCVFASRPICPVLK